MTDRERARTSYEGMPAYDAGRKDVIEELRDYINNNVTLKNDPNTSLKMICDKVAEMCRNV